MYVYNKRMETNKQPKGNEMSKSKIGQKVKVHYSYNPQNEITRQGTIYTVNEEDGVFGAVVPTECKNGTFDHIEYPLVFGTTEDSSGTLVTVTAI